MANQMEAVALASLLTARPRRFALLDVREAGEAERSHIPGASALPRRLLEFRVASLVRSLEVPLVIYDGGDGRARLAGRTLEEAGFVRVSILSGGLPAWSAAGLPLATGFNVPSKTFGEHVLSSDGVPSIRLEALAALTASGRPFSLWDVRTPAEYRAATLPGAVSGASFEMVLHAADAARAGDPIVLHCAGRTRSIIATRTLQLLGFENVTAVENGTMGWVLEGRELEHGADRTLPAPSAEGLRMASHRARDLAVGAGVVFRPADEAVAAFSGGAPALHLFDVRSARAFARSHAAGAVHAPGGQLIQCTDEYVAVESTPILLMDDGDARAAVAGYWLARMGFPQVHVVENGLPGWIAAGGVVTDGPQRSTPLGLDAVRRSARFAEPADLLADPARAVVVDVGTSRDFAAGHVPGARWIPRGWLELRGRNLPANRLLVITARDERQALFAAVSAARELGRPVLVLRGGNDGWRAAGGPLETGDAPEPDFGTDIVTPPYAKGPHEMRRYLDWEQKLHRGSA